MEKKLDILKNNRGFIAALDQSGGSTPKALKLYGVDESMYSGEEEMFKEVHKMRSRIITSPSFTSERILGAILFKVTMNSKIEDMYTADYLWEKKGIVPFLKVDEGLADLEDGVQLMKEMKGLDELLEEAKKRNIFGTKMRSVIKEFDEESIKKVVAQQFKYAKKIMDAGFVPIVEPEVDINAKDKEKIEEVLLKYLVEEMKALEEKYRLMFKFTLPTVPNLYDALVEFPQTVRIVALSGGYSREKSNELLAQNKNMIASFSRALTEGLNVKMTDEEFNKKLDESIQSIYDAC